MEKRVALNRSIIVGVLTTLAAIAVIATSMLAPRETEAASNCTYYSDASHTQEVGSCWSDCCNCASCTCSGQVTPYAVPVPVDWLVCY